MKCLKVIRDDQEHYIRVPDDVAEIMLTQENVTHTSKSKFKAVMKSNLPKFTSGKPYPGNRTLRKYDPKKKGMNGQHTPAYRKKHFQEIIDKETGKVIKVIKHTHI